MGLLTRIGIPLGIALIAGLVLARFRDPILRTLSTGAGTIGQALTQPIAGFLEGVGSGIENIPKLPAFPDIFGDIFKGFPNILPSVPSVQGDDSFQGFTEEEQAGKIISPCKCESIFNFGSRSEECIPCAGEAVGGAQDTVETVTPAKPVFKIQLGGANTLQLLTFDQITDLFGFKGAQSLNIIDFKSTPETRERIPITEAGLEKLESTGGDQFFFLGSIGAGSKIGQGLALDPALV